MDRYFHIDLPDAPYTARPTLVPVGPQSSIDLRDEVERFARYFLREMHTGGIQFEASETEQSPWHVPYKAFLLAREGNYVGAACFRYREDQDKVVPWLFDWLWIHPFCRHKGILTAVWGELNTQVGAFRLAQPISAHMQAFLGKVRESAA